MNLSLSFCNNKVPSNHNQEYFLHKNVEAASSNKYLFNTFQMRYMMTYLQS